MVTTKDGLKKSGLILVLMLFLLIQIGLTVLNDLKRVPFFWFLTLINAFVVFTMVCLFLLLNIENKEHRKIRACIEKNLKLMGAYTLFFEDIHLLPSVTVKEGLISIDIDNLNIRKILENNIDLFSSALPVNYIVNEFFLSKDETKLFIGYENVEKPTRYIFESIKEYKESLKGFDLCELPLDKKRNINLKECPHLLITGASGSGKSYYSMFLVAYCISKGFDVNILDFKHSYTIFEDTPAMVSYSVEDIAKQLQMIRDKLHERQVAMSLYLKQDSNLIASQCGYPPLIVFVEEYTALMNSGADKKITKDIEAILLEISSIGRTASVHLVLITQVASATNLNTSIRSNLTALVMGNASTTIYETALGCKVPAISAKLEKGEGLAKFDSDIFKFSTPTLRFPLRELLHGQG